MDGDVVDTLRKLWRQSQVAAGVSVPVSRGMAAELCEAAASREVKVDRRVSSHVCKQCCTLLLPGLNCTVRLAARKNKEGREGRSRVAAIRIHCHACDNTSERLGRARKDMRRARSECKERLAEERRAALKQRAREEGKKRPTLPKRAVSSSSGEAQQGGKNKPSTLPNGRTAVRGEKSAKGKAENVKKSTRVDPKIMKTKKKKKKGGNSSLQKMLSQARKKQGAQEEEDYSLGSFLKSL